MANRISFVNNLATHFKLHTIQNTYLRKNRHNQLEAESVGLKLIQKIVDKEDQMNYHMIYASPIGRRSRTVRGRCWRIRRALEGKRVSDLLTKRKSKDFTLWDCTLEKLANKQEMSVSTPDYNKRNNIY